MRSPGYYWWALRRDLRRGWRASWSAHFHAARISAWRNPLASTPAENVAVHLLCGGEQLILGHWMMASWIAQTRRNWRFVLHDDGTLPRDAARRFQESDLSVRVIPRPESDARMTRALAGHPACADYRQRHPLALKIFDIPAYAGGQRVLVLDTDVLFFAPPNEILAWVDRDGDDAAWFNEDCAEASSVAPAEAREKLGVTLWPRVNSGLILLPAELIDLDFCEQVLSETSIQAGHIWRIEQTLFALNASRRGRGGLLPPTYEVSLGRSMSPGAIARHYVGAVRDRFWGEGVWSIRRSLGISLGPVSPPPSG